MLTALIIAAGLLTAGGGTVAWMTAMPGHSHGQALPPLTAQEATIQLGLARHIDALAADIGERNTRHPAALERAALYVEGELAGMGYEVQRQEFEAHGVTVRNLEVYRPGLNTADGQVLVGAHYDSAPGTRGADDNASGVAALLELARLLADHEPNKGLRLVAWVNEEPPHFQGPGMGSVVHARSLAARNVKLWSMLSLETGAYFDTTPGSQEYPPGFAALYPDAGDFIAFVGNTGSRKEVRRTLATFRETATVPSEGAAVPGGIPGVGWSDHWAYWQEGYPGVMVTDTAPFRNPHYHEQSDTPPTLDLGRAARVVAGLAKVVEVEAGVR